MATALTMTDPLSAFVPEIHVGRRLEELAGDIRRCTRSYSTWEEKRAGDRRRSFLKDISHALGVLWDKGQRTISVRAHDDIVSFAMKNSKVRRLQHQIAKRDAELAELTRRGFGAPATTTT